MTFGINLSPPGAVIYEDTDLADLNGGAGIASRPSDAVTGETGVRSILSSTAQIYIAVDGDIPEVAGDGGDGIWITILKIRIQPTTRRFRILQMT
jgi:hypothetical protein